MSSQVFQGVAVPAGWVPLALPDVQGRFRVLAYRPPDKTTRLLLAEDRNIPERQVVLKTAPCTAVAEVAALTRERDVLVSANHRGLPRVYGFFEEVGRRYLVLEFVADRVPLRRQAIPHDRAVALVSHLLQILEYLHRLPEPVVHGDVKPGNLLVHEHDPHLTLIDFGAAHQGSAPSPLVHGTRGYASPEQTTGGAPRPSWDLYSATVVLHEMLTGVDPLTWAAGSPPLPDSLPAPLRAVLERALHANPKQRPATAHELRSLLENALALAQDSSRCPGCRKLLPKSVVFCHHCGAASRALAQARPPRIPIRRKQGDVLSKALASGSYCHPPLQYLRQEVDALCRPLGFDTLMTLDQHEIEPMEHQVNVVKRVLHNMQGRAVLADEVGLGKTIEAALVRAELKARGLVGRTLILTPPHLKEQWREEMFEKFHEKFSVHGTEVPVDLQRAPNLIVSLAAAMGRKGAEAVPQTLSRRRWDLVIVDEAHHARNRDTRRWRFLASLQTNYLLLLTATPMQNSLQDLFNLMSLVRPGLLQPTWNRFCRQYGVDGVRVQRQGDLRRDAFKVMIRTRRSEAYVKFPERDSITRLVRLSPAEQRLYDGVSRFVQQIGATAGGQARLTLMHLQQRLTSSPDAVADSLQTLVDKGDTSLLPFLQQARALRGGAAKLEELVVVLEAVQDRVVVFTDHVPTQKLLVRQLTERGYRTSLYRGNTAEKAAAVREFGQRGQVLVVSAAGNEGLNLHHWCHILVNYDLPWNPMKVEQRIGRLQRLGQQRKVLVFNLAAEGTVEQQVLRVLHDKIRLFEIAIGQLDLILGEALSDEHSFQEKIWKCLLEARNAPDLAHRLDHEFDKALKGAGAPSPGLMDLL